MNHEMAGYCRILDKIPGIPSSPAKMVNKFIIRYDDFVVWMMSASPMQSSG
jgi:hypothetical protein